MTMAPPAGAVATGGPRRLGQSGARLLAGPGDKTPETLGSHLQRLGPLPGQDPDGFMAVISAAGVGGRGGGGFPVARKLTGAGTLASSRHQGSLLIVNAAESEPASRKDRTLCTLRPHLVLDGGSVAAATIGAAEATVYCHSGEVARAMTRAMAEREALAGPVSPSTRAPDVPPDPRWRVLVGPDRFVAGESTAAASFADGGEARPRFLSAPLAVAGVSGRPTVVHNAETLAHLGLLVRFGAAWWREAGTPDAPGSRLVTVAGAVPTPGSVREVIEPVTIGALLSESGLSGPPAAVLIGGYAGSWASGDAAWTTCFEPADLRRIGAGVGCGLIAALPHGSCPLTETARLAAYLAGESAGQCGPCVYGLSDVAELVVMLAAGQARRRHLRRLCQRLEDVTGRGGCHHPDGVASMVDSALRSFPEEVSRHLRGHCTGITRRDVLLVPNNQELRG